MERSKLWPLCHLNASETTSRSKLFAGGSVETGNAIILYGTAANCKGSNHESAPASHSPCLPFPHSCSSIPGGAREPRISEGNALFLEAVRGNRYVYSASWWVFFFFFFDVEIFVSRPLYILVSLGYSSFSALSVGALQYCRTSGRRWRRRRRRFPALTYSVSAVCTVPVLVTRRCYMPLLLPEQVLHRTLLQKVSYALQAQGTNKS